MAEVFISYHEASAGALAGEIAGRLDKAGISSWCARRDMPPGADFADEIPSQIDACRLFLLLLNENVYSSYHIENEMGLAFGRRNAREEIQILPVEIGDFQRKRWIRYYLIHTQSVKFPAEPDEESLQGLVKQVAKLLGKDPVPQQKPTPAPPPVQTPPPEQPKEEPTPEPPPAKIIKSGECGYNVTYTLDEYGVLTISGKGYMLDFSGKNPPWWDNRTTILHVRIQDGVTDIGDRTFQYCAKLKSVTIPDSVTEIGEYTFYACQRLTSVTIPDSVTYIGDSAFCGCTRLTSVMIPDSVIHIGCSAFRNCSGLTSVTIPDSVTTIRDWAFYDCAGLTSVSVPARAKIGAFAFPITTRIEYRA